MPEPNDRPDPAPRPAGSAVAVSRFPFDWGTGGDPGHVTEQRLASLCEALQRGAWFLNPAYLIRASAPSAEFFAAARQARRRWLDEVRGSLNNPGLREQSRQAGREGRRAALLALDHPDGPHPAPAALRPADLPPEQRGEVRLFGHIAKQMAFTGLMIVDGNHVLPRTWNRMADELLGPEPGPRVSRNRRRTDPAAPRPPATPKPKAPAISPSEPSLRGA